MVNLKEDILKRVKGKSLKLAALLLTITTITSLSGCSNESTDNKEESKSSYGRKVDASKIKNNGIISDEVLVDLNSSYGFMDYIKNTDFSYEFEDNDEYLSYLNIDQKKAIFEIAKHLELHLNAKDEEKAKKELDEIAKYIEKFYDGQNPVDVMNKILSNFIPQGITPDKGTREFVNDKGTVYPISAVKSSIGYNNNIETSYFDHHILIQLMLYGFAYGTNDISEEIDTINILMHLCGEYTNDHLIEFKDKNGCSYLGHKKMFKDVLSYDNAYKAMYDGGIFNNFNVIYTSNGDFDVKVGNQTFYTLTVDDDQNVVAELAKHLTNNRISSDVLKKEGLMRIVVEELLVMDNKEKSQSEKIKTL